MKLSHLNGLRALEATLRRGTFSAAAEELGVTVAAIGQQLRLLEDYLGIRLFDRLPSGAKPTPEACEVAERLTAGFAQLEDAMAGLRGARDGRTLSLSLTYHYLDHWLSPRLPRLYAMHSDIEIQVGASDRMVDLLSENVDMAIRYARDAGPGYRAIELVHGCYFPVCTPEFATAHALTPDCRDLSDVPLFVLYDATTDPDWGNWPTWIKEFGMTAGEMSGARRTTGQLTALSGAGLVITGLTEAFNDLRSGSLVAPLGSRVIRQSTYQYLLVWPAARRLNRAMQSFCDWIVGERDRYLIEASNLLGRDLT